MLDEADLLISDEEFRKQKEAAKRRERIDRDLVEAAKHVRAQADSQLSRQRVMSASGYLKDGAADMVAHAIRTGNCVPLAQLPPTAASPAGTLMTDDDQMRNTPSTRYCEDWTETTMLGALPKFLGIGAHQPTSLEAALIARATSTRMSYDDMAILTMTAPPTLHFLARERAIDVVFRWKRGGGATEDAPVVLQSIASTAVPMENDIKRLQLRKTGRDGAPPMTAFLRPAFVLPESVVPSLALDTALAAGNVPVDLLLLRACCYYTYAAVHHQFTGFMAFNGAASMPRILTSQIEDEFMRHLLALEVDEGKDGEEHTLDRTLGLTLFGCDAGFDARRFNGHWEAPPRRRVKHNGKRIAALLKTGRSSQDADPLASIESIYPDVHCVNFSICLALAAASLRGPPTCGLPRTARWLSGTPLTLDEAVVRLARTTTRLLWLDAFHAERRARGRCDADEGVQYLAFESHASVGLGAFKRALHTMSTLLAEHIAPRKLRPWYALIPYTRRTEPLPGFLLVAERDHLQAANTLYERVYRNDPSIELPVLRHDTTRPAAAAAASAATAVDVKGMALPTPPVLPTRVFDVKFAGDPHSMNRTDVDAIVVLVDDEAAVMDMTPAQLGELRAGRVASSHRSLYNDDELVNFSYSWPSQLTDPCEFHMPGTREAVQRTAAALRKYLCVTDAAAAAYAAREVSVLSK